MWGRISPDASARKEFTLQEVIRPRRKEEKEQSQRRMKFHVDENGRRKGGGRCIELKIQKRSSSRKVSEKKKGREIFIRAQRSNTSYSLEVEKEGQEGKKDSSGRTGGGPKSRKKRVRFVEKSSIPPRWPSQKMGRKQYRLKHLRIREKAPQVIGSVEGYRREKKNLQHSRR